MAKPEGRPRESPAAAVPDADRILVLAGGRLVESGRHSELLARRGRYAQLYRSHRPGPA